jgi:FtsZ-binding cell division protein ZapB
MMQLPGLDELEESVGRAVETVSRLRTENAALKERFRALGKELEDLADQVTAIGSGQKVDSRKKKRLEQRLRSIVSKLA